MANNRNYGQLMVLPLPMHSQLDMEKPVSYAARAGKREGELKPHNSIVS